MFKLFSVLMLAASACFAQVQNVQVTGNARIVGNALLSTNLMARPSTLLSGLVEYWKLDQPGGNETGKVSGITLTDVGTRSYQTPGFNGLSANCFSNVNGGTDHLRTTNSVLLPTTITVSFWYKLNKGGNQYSILCGGGNASSGQGSSYEMTIDNSGYLAFKIWTNFSNNGFQYARYRNATLTNNNWHFVVGILNPVAGDSTNIYLWYDNATVPIVSPALIRGDVSGMYNMGTNRFSVGNGSRFAASSGDNFGGNMSELAIWNRALSTNEIGVLYNSGAGRTHPFTGAP
jgi:hypothetical protein